MHLIYLLVAEASSDDSKVEICDLKHHQYVAKRSGEQYNSECKTHALYKTERYGLILVHHVIPSRRHLISSGFILA